MRAEGLPIGPIPSMLSQFHWYIVLIWIGRRLRAMLLWIFSALQRGGRHWVLAQSVIERHESGREQRCLPLRAKLDAGQTKEDFNLPQILYYVHPNWLSIASAAN